MSNYREYCVVAIWRSKFGNKYRELYKGRRKDCKAFINTYCQRTKCENGRLIHNTLDGDWTIHIGDRSYDVCIKEVKRDNSIYNTLKILKDDEKYWTEFYSKINEFGVKDMEITLTKEEKRELKKFLYRDLMMKSEYHKDLYPKKKYSLKTLMESYFYWGDEYNDGYIPEEKETDRLSLYLVQEFKKFLDIPIAVRY